MGKQSNVFTRNCSCRGSGCPRLDRAECLRSAESYRGNFPVREVRLGEPTAGTC